MRCELPPVPAAPPPPEHALVDAALCHGGLVARALSPQLVERGLDRGLRHRLARLAPPEGNPNPSPNLSPNPNPNPNPSRSRSPNPNPNPSPNPNPNLTPTPTLTSTLTPTPTVSRGSPAQGDLAPGPRLHALDLAARDQDELAPDAALSGGRLALQAHARGALATEPRGRR